MTRPLVVLFVALEALDFATYAMAPHLEANPAMAALGPAGVAVAKSVAVLAALLIVSRICPAMQPLALALGIAIAAFGVGANVASLTAPGSAGIVNPIEGVAS